MPHIHRKVSCIAAKERPEKFVRSNNWLCKQTSRLRARFKRISDRRRQQPSRQDPSRPIRIHTSKRKNRQPILDDERPCPTACIASEWMYAERILPLRLPIPLCCRRPSRMLGLHLLVRDDRNSSKPLLDASSPSSHSNAQALRLQRSGCAFSVLLHRFRVPMTTTCSSVHVRRAVVAWNVPFLIHGFHEKIPVHLDIPLRIP